MLSLKLSEASIQESMITSVCQDYIIIFTFTHLVKVRLVLQQRLYHARLVEFCCEVEGSIAIFVQHVNVGENVGDHGDELKHERKLNLSSSKYSRLSIVSYVCN